MRLQIQRGRGWTAGVAGVCLALFSGCAESAGPKEALRSYVTAIADGNLRAAFESLSERSRRSLEEAAARAGGGQGGYELFHTRMTTQGGAGVPWITPTTLEKVQLDELGQSGDSASVRVTSPLGSWEVRLVRESGRWLVELEP
jgi:hypothetical protein